MQTNNNVIVPDFGALPRTVAPTVTPKQMLSVEKDGNQTHVQINSSSLGLLLTCARKSKYSLIDRWQGKNISTPLVFGLAIHKALEVFYAHGSKERTIPMDFDEVAPLLVYGHAAPAKHFLYDALQAFVKEGEPLRDLPDTDKRSLASGIWLLTHYFRTYLHDTYVIHTDASGPVTERFASASFLETPRLKITLFGTIDFILKNEATGEVLPGDHKTSSQMGMDFLNRVKPNHQYTGYSWLARKVLGISSENFLVNGIGVKARPLTARGGPPTFTRQITRRTEADFAEFSDVLLFAVESFLRWQESGVWPLGHVDACSNFGGCAYLEVCSAPNQLRENILNAKFQRGNV